MADNFDKPELWNKFVKRYSQEHNISLKQAMMSDACKAQYQDIKKAFNGSIASQRSQPIAVPKAEPKPRAPRGRGKKVVDEYEEEPPRGRGRGRPSVRYVYEDEAPPPKKAPVRRAPAKKRIVYEDEEVEEEEVVVVKRRPAPKKAPVKRRVVYEDDEDLDDYDDE